jgi:DNA-directed RNA polymerase subunit H (RpoH/RPB5)
MGKLDRLIKSVAALNEDEQKAIFKAMDVYGDDTPVVTPEVEAQEAEKEEPTVATPQAQPQVVTETVTEPTIQASDNLFDALQAQLSEVLKEVRGLKEAKDVLESEKKELEEKVTKQPFGLHGKVQTKDTAEDSSFDVEKLYSQNLKRY